MSDQTNQFFRSYKENLFYGVSLDGVKVEYDSGLVYTGSILKNTDLLRKEKNPSTADLKFYWFRFIQTCSTIVTLESCLSQCNSTQ